MQHTIYNILHTTPAGFIKFTKRSLSVLLLSSILLTGTGIYYLFFLPRAAEAAWFDDSWGYRQRVDITNSGSAQTDFQVSFTLDTNTLFDAGKLQSDCDDIRVTDASGKLLPYWIEQMATACGDSNSAQTIWVKMPTVNTTGNTLYVYYGNPSASAYSNGQKVFEFFDDFSAATLDGTKWSATGAYSVSGGALTVTTGAVYTNSTIVSNASNMIYETRNSWTQITGTHSTLSIGASQGLAAGNTTGIKNVLYSAVSSVVVGYGSNNGGSGYNIVNGTTQYTPVAGTTYINSFSMDSTNLIFYQNRTQTNSYAGVWTDAAYLWLGQYQGNLASTTNANDIVADWVIARKFASTAPSSASPTNEEKPDTTPVGYWKFDEGTDNTCTSGGSTDVCDSTANANHGSSGNGPTWLTEDQCVSGKCLRLDGTDDFVNMGDVLDRGSDDFTVSTWVRTAWSDASSDEGMFIAKFESLTKEIRFGLSYSNTNKGMRILLDDGTTEINVEKGEGTANINDNNWHHLVWTIDRGGNATYYKDGVSLGTTSLTTLSGSLDNTGSWNIGRWNGNYFPGAVDEIKFYPQALTATQVKAAYNSKASGDNTSVILGSKATPGSALSNGLVGYWKMDEASWTSDCSTEEVLDASGNSNNGESCPNGAANDPVVGKFGNAGSFDGTNDNVAIDDATSLRPVSTVTLSAWVYTSSTTQTSVVIGKQAGTGVNNNYALYPNAGNMIMCVTGGSTCSNESRDPSDVPSATWTHYVGVFDGTKTYLYKNGALLDSDTSSISTLGTYDANPVLIGADSNDASPGADALYWTGSIDEARVYNRALSPDEVSQLYNFAPGPVAYYKMDEGTGTTSTFDSSGNSSTGTLQSMTASNWTTGKYGKALSFNGSTNYITGTPSSANFNKQFTFEAWYKKNGEGSGGAERLISYPSWGLEVAGNSGNNAAFYLSWNDASNTGWTTIAAISTGTWYHLTLTYDGTYVRGYINGVQQYSANTWSGKTLSTVASGNIGASGSSNGAFNGVIDETKLYNYARTTKQIIEDMNAGHPNVGSPVGSAVGHWRFNEGADNTCSGGTNDYCNSGSQGSTLDGAKNGTVSFTQAGKFGKAISPDGTSGYGSVADHASLDFGTGDFSASVWVEFPLAGTSTWNGIVTKGITTGAPANTWGIWSGNPATNLVYQDATDAGGAWNVTVGYDASALSGWHHVAVTRSGTAYKMYVDSVNVASGTGASTVTLTNASNLQFGNADSRFFSKDIDEVKVYTYALTASEIKLDMNQGQAQVLGAAGTNSSYQINAANQQYCVPGGADTCTAPIGEWWFDEGASTTAYDKSGNGFTGTTTGAVYSTGKVGKGLSFDGVSDYVTISDHATLRPSAITVEAWINVTSVGTTWQRVLNKGWASAGSWTLLLGTNDMSFRIMNSVPTSFNAISTDSISANTWHHVVGTFDGTTVRVYVDGKLGETTGTVSGSGFLADTSSIEINDATDPLTGKIDQVSIYSYARSAAQVAWDYNKGEPVGHWRFDECQGTTAYDSSLNGNGTVNGNNGTITVGATGTYTSVGTCPVSSASSMWYNGATGKRNYSLAFDGTDDYVNVPDPSSGILDFGTNDFTVSAWVKTSTGSSRILTKGGGGNPIYQLMMDSTTASFYVRGTEGNSATTTSTTTITDGNWHLITGVHSGTNIMIYVDGRLEDTDAETAGSVDSALPITIGQFGSSNLWFTGQIDDVKVYNYALTATQVKNLYNGGAVNYTPVTGSP